VYLKGGSHERKNKIIIIQSKLSSEHIYLRFKHIAWIQAHSLDSTLNINQADVIIKWKRFLGKTQSESCEMTEQGINQYIILQCFVKIIFICSASVHRFIHDSV